MDKLCKMKRLIKSLFPVFIICTRLLANPADSLSQLVNSTESGNDKGIKLLRLADEYGLKERNLFVLTNKRILEIGDISNKIILAKANENLGDSFWEIMAMDSSRYFYNRALTGYLSENKVNNAGIIFYKLAQVYNISANYKAALQYANEALSNLKAVDDRPDLANVFALLCDIQSKMGLREKAINDCITSLKIYDETGKLQGKASILNSIGNIYLALKQLDKCEQYFREALGISRLQNNRSVIAQTLNNLGDTFSARDKPDSAFHYYDMALIIHRQDKDIRQLAATYLKIGKAYIKSNNLKIAINYLDESLKFAQQTPDNELKAVVYSEIGNLYSQQGELRLAINYLKRALADAQRVGSDPILQSCYNSLAKYYDRLGDKENALVYFKLYMLHTEAMFANQSAIKIAETEALYNLDKKEKEIQLLKSENRIKDLEVSSRKLINILLISGLIAVISFSVIIYRQYRIQNKANLFLSYQKEAIDTQKHEIEIQRDNITKANLLLEDKNRQITDSIEYAKRIQFSLLPDSNLLKSKFSSSFIIHLPKDIVSGDFFYIEEIEQYIYLAAIDCTGHGVPGAFMTVLAQSLLNQIISANSEIHTTNEIIEDLDQKVVLNLNRHGIPLSAFEGMDMGLFRIDRMNKRLDFTGAKMPAYYFDGLNIIQIDGDRYSIGGNGIKKKNFTMKSISYKDNDIIYLATDGYQDQFGGENGRKFMKIGFRNLLSEIIRFPVKQQEDKLITVFNEWKANNPQTDDVLILGIQL
jgi:tetratricopeptide (TPR) repeat protein/serine phosphatase RsbU (regulator of sigma subunit)